MSDDTTQQHDDQDSTTRQRRRRWLLGGGLAAVVIIGGAVAWASGVFSAGEPETLGSADAIAAGERRAAELSGDSPEIVEKQSVAGSGLFSYQFDADDVAASAAATPFIGNQLLVAPTEKGGFAAVQDAAKELDAVIVGVNDYISTYQLLLPGVLDEDELDSVVEKMSENDELESVRTNVLIPMSPEGVPTEGDADLTPEQAFADAATSSEWLKGSWGMQAIGAPVLWDYAERMSLVPTDVGVFDTYRDGRSHEDLADAEFPVALDPDTAKMEPNSHGLHVAGTIGANKGALGAAPNANLKLDGYDAKSVFQFNWGDWFRWETDDDPTELNGMDENTLSAGITSLAESGASIINVSQGFSTPAAAERDESGARDEVAEIGTNMGESLKRVVKNYPDLLLVAAAGNSACSAVALEEAKQALQEAEAADEEPGQSCLDYTTEPIKTSAEWGYFTQARTQFPELEDHILVVGSAAPLFSADVRSEGLEAWGRSQWGADVLAPGASILSTVDPDDCNDKTSAWCEAGYGYMSGTSMAAPHVAGVATALRGANPDLSAGQLMRIILGTADGAPMLQVNEGAAGLASQETSMINAAAALQLAIQTKTNSGKEIDSVLDQALDSPTVSPQLQGSWCPTDQSAADAADCLNLADFLAEHTDAELTQSEALDPTGRSSLAAVSTLCVDGPCASASETVEVRYYPPGAVWECSEHASPHAACPDDAGEQLAAHAVGWPRVLLTYQSDDNITRTEALRINLLADGEFSDLPEVSAAPVSTTWCPTDDSPEDACLTISASSDTASTATFDSGTPMTLTRMPGDDRCIDYIGGDAGGISSQMPLGRFCPAGVDAQINDFYGVQDRPEQDRVWNGQTGVLYLRQN